MSCFNYTEKLLGIQDIAILKVEEIDNITHIRITQKNVDAFFADSENVKVTETKDYYFFDSPDSERVLLFYPGGKIDEKAYAPILRMVAEAGVDVYCFHMPFYFAFLDIDRADSVLADSSYTQVFVGGHSLGGAIAARYVHHTDRDIRGLVLFGAFSDMDLTDNDDLYVFSTYGTLDQILNLKQYEKYRANLPSNRLTELIVENGNHSRCASYGDIFENPEGAISYEEQWDIMSEALIEWIYSLDNFE